MAMKRYDQNFKTGALKLSDDIGVKKACEQLNVNYGRFIFSGAICTAEKHVKFALYKRHEMTYARSAHQCNSLRELIFSQLLHFKEPFCGAIRR